MAKKYLSKRTIYLLIPILIVIALALWFQSRQGVEVKQTTPTVKATTQNQNTIDTTVKTEPNSQLKNCLDAVSSSEQSFEATDALLKKNIQDCYDKYQ